MRSECLTAIGNHHPKEENEMDEFTRERIERVARLYASNQEASQALGIAMPTFGRLCRRYGIESPYARRRRRLREGGSQNGERS